MRRRLSEATRGGAAVLWRIAGMLALLCVAACGFQPLHHQAYHAGLAVDLSALRIEVTGAPVENNVGAAVGRHYGELLKAEIEDQVNPAGNPGEKLFKVAIRYSEGATGLFVNPDGTASRGDLIYTSTYAISRLSDGAPIASGTLSRTSSYNTSPTADYVSYVSVEDARKRGIIELAQDYKLRLAALLQTLNHPDLARDALAAEKQKAINNANLPTLQPIRTNEARTPGY